jgi:hypothetical protein
MKAITKWTKPACSQVSAATIKELAGLAAELGLKVERTGGGTFDPDAGTFAFKVQFTLADAEPERVEFERNCFSFDLKPEHYGAEFTNGARLFRLTGLHPRRSKWPVSGVCLKDGKSYKFRADVLRKFQTPKNVTPIRIGNGKARR